MSTEMHTMDNCPKTHSSREETPHKYGIWWQQKYTIQAISPELAVADQLRQVESRGPSKNKEQQLHLVPEVETPTMRTHY
ncbi:hypothetical protein ACFX13_030810 [Malus domestica]